MADEAPLPPHLQHGIETIADMHARAAVDLTRHQRLIEWFTLRIGRPRTIYAVVVLVTGWLVYNVMAPKGSAFDPYPFDALQGLLSFLALVVAIMVLTTQNRQGRHAENRSHVDLQVNLVAEQKVAKLIQLIEELRADLPNVPNRADPVAEAMQSPTDMRVVLEATDAGSRPEGK